MTGKLDYYDLVQYAPFLLVVLIIITFYFLYNYLSETYERNPKDWVEKW